MTPATAPRAVREIVPDRLRHSYRTPPNSLVSRPFLFLASRAEPANQSSHVLRAVARAWGWRRKLETGAMANLQDIAAAEKFSDRFIGRMMRLAYLSPDVLERLVTQREPAALSLNDLVTVADLPWPEQAEVVFG